MPYNVVIICQFVQTHVIIKSSITFLILCPSLCVSINEYHLMNLDSGVARDKRNSVFGISQRINELQNDLRRLVRKNVFVVQEKYEKQQIMTVGTAKSSLRRFPLYKMNLNRVKIVAVGFVYQSGPIVFKKKKCLYMYKHYYRMFTWMIYSYFHTYRYRLNTSFI